MSKTKFIYSFGKLSLLALFTFISGCDKQQPVIEKQTTVNDEIRKPDEEKTKPAKFKDLDCVIPETYPAELLAYTVDDIEAIALSKSGKKNFIVKGNSGKTLGEIIDNVLRLCFGIITY